jgi:TPR repeat protein
MEHTRPSPIAVVTGMLVYEEGAPAFSSSSFSAAAAPPSPARLPRGASCSSSSTMVAPPPRHTRCSCATVGAPSDAPTHADERCTCCGSALDAEPLCALGSVGAQDAALLSWSSRSYVELRAAAEAGDIAAATVLATSLQFGLRGAPCDVMQALSWLFRAASANVAAAQVALGINYENGIGVAPDIGEAVRLYKRAAHAGFAPAHKCLGVCFRAGRGMPLDKQQAFCCFERGAALCCKFAMVELSHCYLDGTGCGADHTLACTWARRALSEGDRSGQAEVVLALVYSAGVAVPRNDVQATALFAAAAAKGSDAGVRGLCLLADHGDRGRGCLSCAARG